MRVVLHQRGGERVLEGLAILERDVLDRLHGVEVLREAHRQAGLAELLDEPGQQLGDGRAGGGARGAMSVTVLLAGRGLQDGAVLLVELAHRLGDVALVLQQDVDRGLGRLGVDVLDAEQQQRAGPVDRLGHRR